MSNKDRVWRVIPGWDQFEVSNDGLVRRAKPNKYGAKVGHILTPKTNQGGYLNISLKQEGRHRQLYVHRLVALAFIGDPPTLDYQVNHINGDRQDNRVENLEYVTAAENVQHAYGDLKRQGSFGAARITPEQVKAIRKLRIDGVPVREIAKQFSLSRANVYLIISGKSWGDVE